MARRDFSFSLFKYVTYRELKGFGKYIWGKVYNIAFQSKYLIEFGIIIEINMRGW